MNTSKYQIQTQRAVPEESLLIPKHQKKHEVIHKYHMIKINDKSPDLTEPHQFLLKFKIALDSSNTVSWAQQHVKILTVRI